jgi:hypothetical protein
MSTKLQKGTPAWHADAIAMVKGNFAQIHNTFCDATKRAVWLGFFLITIKQRGKEDGSIPHGMFMPWMEKNLPEVGHSQAAVYQTLARNVAEKGKIQISDFRKFAEGGELPDKVIKLIEGKTQDQLMFSFKQVEERDGENHAKRGRLKGEGGATKAQRAQAKQIQAETELAGLRIQIAQFGELADALANDAAIGEPQAQAQFDEVYPKIENLFRYMQRIQQARSASRTSK